MPGALGTGKETGKTILLVDSDLGFVFWLGQTLDLAGYSTIPAKDVRAAKELVYRHKIPVDILVIDPLLPDAFAFISHLRQPRPSLHVIASIPENWERVPPMAEVDALIRKPRHLSAVAAVPWINLIRRLSADIGPSSTALPKLLRN